MQDGKIVLPGQPSTMVPEPIKKRIDKWIKKNNLNEFGDPKDTVYAGGSPLFDESCGMGMSRYEYILKNHPELGE